MKVNLIYITAGDRDEARRIGKILVTQRLAACVNILDNMNSMYVWKDELQDDTETVLIAKTTEEKVPALIDAVKAAHSYECPCIVCLPIVGGHTDFLNWIAEQVR